MSADTALKHTLITWLDKHIDIQKRISRSPLPVSSDVIESLFGRFKQELEHSPPADMNRSVRLIPAMCGELNQTVIQNAMSVACHDELTTWEHDNIPYTMRQKRHHFFQNKSQKVGKNNLGYSRLISTA